MDSVALRFRTRTSVKQDKVVVALRRQIAEGMLAPGQQIPTRNVLEKQFDVSGVTLQRALDRLMEEGLIFARGSMGTYVTENPPHLSRYGLIFPYMAGPGEQGNRFFATLAEQAMELQRPDRQIPIYADDLARPGSENYRRLMYELATFRFAGLIFTHPPECVFDSVLLKDRTIPCVAITDPTPVDIGMPIVALDDRSFIDNALKCLALRQRKRVAVIASGAWLSRPGAFDRLHGSLQAHGLRTESYWTQVVDLNYVHSAKWVTQLLMKHTSDQDRPDAIVVTDDNLTDHVIAGLLSSGINQPEEIVIVSHCNFPAVPYDALPVCRVGFDTCEILTKCIDLIDAGRQRRAVAPVHHIRAKYFPMPR